MKTLGTWFGGLVGVFGALIVLAGLLVGIAQVATWLKTGIWPRIGMGALWDGQPLPTTDWVGLQTVFDWFFNFPLVIGGPFIGVSVANIGVKIWASSWGEN